MSISHSPTRNSDSLIVDLDMWNQKSYSGAPVANEFVATTWTGDGANQSFAIKESILVTDPKLKYKGYDTYLWTPGASLNSYLNDADISSSRTSTVWTFAAVLRREDRKPISSMSVYMYYPTSDGSAAGTIVDLGDGWYLVYRTRTGTSNYISLAGFTGFAASTKYYISGATLSKTNYPVIGVPANTTQTSTITNLAGSEAFTYVIGSSSGNLDNIQFNTTNDSYINATTPNNLVMGAYNFTISAWVDLLGTGYQIINESRGASLAGYLFILNYSSAGRMSIFLTETGAPSGQRVLTTTKSTLGTGKKHIAAVVDRANSLVTFYVNGILYESIVIPHTASISPSSGAIYRIGYDLGGSTANYKIYNYKHWTKALTATEIATEFETKRGRFGL